MHAVKIRRVGSGNVVSVPSALAEHGYGAGQRVTIETLPTGDLLIRRVVDRDKQLQATARRLIQRHRKSLDILAACDDREITTRRPSRPVGL